SLSFNLNVKVIFLCLLLFSLGCSEGNIEQASGSTSKAPTSQIHIYSSGTELIDALTVLPRGTQSLVEVCKVKNNSRLWTTFCNSSPPNITSLRQLFAALGVTDESNTSCTTNSVSLVRNGTSVLNPRCIRFSSRSADSDLVAVGFQRDETTLVEIVAKDPLTKKLHFYLGDFELACEQSESGCPKGVFFTEAAESNWARFSLYEDKILRNTALDCTTCHQPGGLNAPKRLIMAEMEFPWTHWFDKGTDCGQSLLEDFNKAHIGESFYAGTALSKFSTLEAFTLDSFIAANGFSGRSNGNNYFDSLQIEIEVNTTAGQPQTNINQSHSDTWTAEYNRRNALLALDVFGGTGFPYRDCKQSDPLKIDHFSQKLIQFNKGQIAIDQLPPLNEVNLSSEQALRERGLMAPTGLTGPALLKRACLACHNNHLDQTISRANFNAQNLAKNTKDQINNAIYRLRMVKSDLWLMPPKHYLDLSEEEVLTLINYLKAFNSSRGHEE
ncbi:MAG: hypothetical protein KDD61_08280, partial [Bdellovibrionales bacterium]|nr:hypothetical protein [Bdellovibrionales bacterium]